MISRAIKLKEITVLTSVNFGADAIRYFVALIKELYSSLSNERFAENHFIVKETKLFLKQIKMVWQKNGILDWRK